MNSIVSTTELAHLFDVTPKTIAELRRRGIIEPGSKRGTWRLQASVTGYCRHLREEAAARGGQAASEARTKLGVAQADEVAEVEALWTCKLKAVRTRILSLPERLRDLTARQSAAVTRELRAFSTLVKSAKKVASPPGSPA